MSRDIIPLHEREREREREISILPSKVNCLANVGLAVRRARLTGPPTILFESPLFRYLPSQSSFSTLSLARSLTRSLSLLLSLALARLITCSRSRFRPLSHSLARSLTLSLARSLIRSRFRPLSHSLSLSPSLSLARSLTHSLSRSLAHSFLFLLSLSLSRSFARSLTHSLLLSLSLSLARVYSFSRSVTESPWSIIFCHSLSLSLFVFFLFYLFFLAYRVGFESLFFDVAPLCFVYSFFSVSSISSMLFSRPLIPLTNVKILFSIFYLCYFIHFFF